MEFLSMHFRSKIRIAVQIGKWESRCELRSKMGIKKQIGLSKQNHKAKWELDLELRSKLRNGKQNGN